MRTIRVTGKGKLSVKPDTSRITMTLEGRYAEYGETLRRSSEDTETLKDVLAGFGFERTELKTLQFSVDPEYEGYNDKDGIYRQRFVGYRFRHTLKVEFPSDNERLGKVLYALANCRVEPELRISYTVRDPEAAKNKLLGKAVMDSKGKAAVLARAAGVTLKEILSIDYSWGDGELETRPVNGLMMAKRSAAETAGSYDLDMVPDDIELSDTVTVVWELE